MAVKVLGLNEEADSELEEMCASSDRGVFRDDW